MARAAVQLNIPDQRLLKAEMHSIIITIVMKINNVEKLL